MLLVATAHADPSTAEPSDADSYRLQTALCDVAALSLFAMSARSDGDAGVAIGFATYVAAAPIVHMFHHHGERAAASVALRVVLPLIGGALGASAGKSQCDAGCDNDSDIAGTAVGVIVGAIAASAIDIGYLSRGEDAPATPIAPPAPIGPAEPHQVRVGLTFAF
ncbi:MAG TPA: hypothetical protein VGG28_16220 [Kofleriaceae bacterium]